MESTCEASLEELKLRFFGRLDEEKVTLGEPFSRLYRFAIRQTRIPPVTVGRLCGGRYHRIAYDRKWEVQFERRGRHNEW